MCLNEQNKKNDAHKILSPGPGRSKHPITFTVSIVKLSEHGETLRGPGGQRAEAFSHSHLRVPRADELTGAGPV